MDIRSWQAAAGSWTPATRGKDAIDYLVLHGTTGGTAADWAAQAAARALGRSVHYYVDAQGVWQSVAAQQIAWHCGSRRAYHHPACRNANCIGVALCSQQRAGRYVFDRATVQHARALVQQLMTQYAIPAAHVLRHYDVTGKTCPIPFVEHTADWMAFRAALGAG